MKIKDICDINAFSISVNDGIDNIQYLDTGNLTENEIEELQSMLLSEAPSRAQRRVKNNTILYSTVRPNQKHFGILSNPCNNLIASTGFVTLDIKESLKNEYNAQFLYYLLTQIWVTAYLQTLAENSVSSYPSINASDIGNLEFTFPKIEVQRQIATILKNIDDKIVLNRSINRNLEALAKQLYDYWFVQFDFPDENGRPYKSSGGKMVWNEVLKREIPEGWEVKRLGEAVEIKRGKTITEKQTSQGNVKVVAAGLDFSYYHNQSNRDAYCITVSGSGENAGFVNFWREPIYASDCSTIQFEDVIDTLLCYYTLKMQEQRFYRISHKSAQPHILPSDIAAIPMVFPEAKVKERIRDFFIDSNRIIELNTREIERLTHQRDELLPLLMNEQVEVKQLNSDLSLG